MRNVRGRPTPTMFTVLAVTAGLACTNASLQAPLPERQPSTEAAAGAGARAPLAAAATTAPRLTLLPEADAQAPDAGLPPEQEYDLARDLLSRDADAKRRLGDGAETAVVGGVFVLVGARGFTGPAFAASRSLATRALAAFYNGRFEKKPREAITVYLFGDAQTYGAFCKSAIHEPCISVYGFYWPSERWMVMNAGLGLGTLTHELVHPLVEADFPQAPTWLNEGIASIFEAPTFPKPGEIHGAKNWRLPRLRAALGSTSRPKALPHTLFGMTDEVFRDEDEPLHYALARYFCQWMDERGKLWAFYREYRDTKAADPTGVASFKKVMGSTPEELEGAFLSWVGRL